LDFVRRFVNQFRTFRQVASRRSRRRLLRISPEQLECRALLAAVTDSGNTLRIELEAGEQLDIQSNGSSYTFGSSNAVFTDCLLYTSPSPRDRTRPRMPSSA